MRIGVSGAGGRMGREVCRAVSDEGDLDLVCAVDIAHSGEALDGLVPGIASGLTIDGDREALPEKGVEVLVDFSIAEAARETVPFALERGIHCVVGTTGLRDEDLEAFDRAAAANGAGCLLAPNFAVGAVLMMDFAARAGRFLESCEIVELHHPAKLDAPSGTSRLTARRILEMRGGTCEESERGPRGLDIGGIHVHSVRLPGLVAHQEVIFGGQGQSLTIRHDSFDRTSFMPGVILAIRRVRGLRGLTVGLEKIMEL